MCVAAAVVPPGFKRSDCSVTNESLLHGRFWKIIEDEGCYVPMGMFV